MKTAIIIASNRKNSIEDFIQAWRFKSSKRYKVFVIEDGPSKTFNLPRFVKHYCWVDIPKKIRDLVPTKSSALKNLGFYFAYKQGYDYFLCLDDDVLPENSSQSIDDVISSHLKILNSKITKSRWAGRTFNTLAYDYPRGFPECEKEEDDKLLDVKLSIGSWMNIPDIDGKTQMRYEKSHRPFPKHNMQDFIIPCGQLGPICGMHLFFDRDALPYMYFFPTLDTFYRWDDIWMGFLLKVICDEKQWCIHHSGSIALNHSRASDSKKNYELESKNDGYDVNDEFYMQASTSDSNRIGGSGKKFFHYLLNHMKDSMGMPYFNEALDYYEKWVGLFK